MKNKTLTLILFFTCLGSSNLSYSYPDEDTSTNNNKSYFSEIPLSYLEKQAIEAQEKEKKRIAEHEKREKDKKENKKKLRAEAQKALNDAPLKLQNFIDEVEYGYYPEKALFLLLHGPHGSGKTILAENIADYLGWESCFIRPEMLNTSWKNSVSKGLSEHVDPFIESTEDNPEDGRIIIFDEISAYINSQNQGEHAQYVAGVSKLLATFLDKHRNRKKLLFIAILNNLDNISPQIESRFQKRIEIPFPS